MAKPDGSIDYRNDFPTARNHIVVALRVANRTKKRAFSQCICMSPWGQTHLGPGAIMIAPVQVNCLAVPNLFSTLCRIARRHLAVKHDPK